MNAPQNNNNNFCVAQNEMLQDHNSISIIIIIFNLNVLPYMVKTLYLFSLTNTKISDTNECAPAPCKNGATCVDLVGSYRCDCMAGYSGSNCETSKNLILLNKVIG